MMLERPSTWGRRTQHLGTEDDDLAPQVVEDDDPEPGDGGGPSTSGRGGRRPTNSRRRGVRPTTSGRGGGHHIVQPPAMHISRRPK